MENTPTVGELLLEALNTDLGDVDKMSLQSQLAIAAILEHKLQLIRENCGRVLTGSEDVRLN